VTNESPFLDREPIETARALDLLNQASIDLVGQMPYSSNATFLVNLRHDDLVAQAIYKPVAGESPLWDFPPGLDRRERAAFVVSEALGWGLVPPTVQRDDLIHGPGSLQLFMPCVFEEHYFSLREASERFDPTFATIAAFDLVINNTDRKAGHCVLGTEDRIWAIDHGLAFHHEFKLRTVIWDFAGQSIPAAQLADLERFAGELPTELTDLLTSLERDALITRVQALLGAGELPHDDTGGRRYPWPLV